MSFEASLLFETADRLLAKECTAGRLLEAQAGGWLAGPWAALEQAGLTQAMSLGEELPASTAVQLARIAGAHALPLPLAETMLAGWLLARAGLDAPEGAISLAMGDGLSFEGGKARGTLRRVPWGRHVGHVVTVVECDGVVHLLCLPTAGARLTEGANLAFEPRDDLAVDAAPVAAAAFPDGMAGFRAAAAAIRALAMAGAMASVLDLTVQYANERSQFGRPIGKFQAIQHNMAILAGQTAAALGAGDIAAEALGEREIGVPPIAIAKVRAGEAAGIVAGLAHQIHGAIGFSQEYRLHFLTKRLWSWREEFGAEAEWSRLIGRQAVAAGPEGLWPLVASI